VAHGRDALRDAARLPLVILGQIEMDHVTNLNKTDLNTNAKMDLHDVRSHKDHRCWGLRVAVAGLFFLSAGQKFIGDAQYVDEFQKVVLGDWFRLVTAAMETLGGVAVLYPQTNPWGTALLLVGTTGAFVAQITVLHVGWYHCVAIAVVVVGLIHLTRNRSTLTDAT
jgi:putative oxidoreductase